MLLEKTGRSRPLRLSEIHRAITKGGVQISSAQVLFKSLDRAKGDFCRPGKKGSGLWALTDWYSPAELRRMGQKGTGADADTDLDDGDATPDPDDDIFHPPAEPRDVDGDPGEVA